jgi:hypothetical protein
VEMLELSLKSCPTRPKLHPSFDVSSPLNCCPQSHEILLNKCMKLKFTNPTKDRWLELSHARQKKKAKRFTAHKNQKKERTNPFCGRKIFHLWPL